MVEVAYNIRHFIHDLKTEKQITSALERNKLLWLLGLKPQAQAPFQLKILDPVPKLIIKYAMSLSSTVKPINDEDIKKASLRKEELLDVMLDPEKYHSELFTLVIDTYMWYMNEKELFSYLIAKYCAVPFNLNYEEKKMFIENHLSKVRLKILLFLTEWYRKYRDLVLTFLSLQDLFAEVLLIMYYQTEDKKWIMNKMQLVLGYSDSEKFTMSVHTRLKELYTRELKIKENMIRMNQEENDEKLDRYEVFFTLLKYESRKLAEQICIFDFENFQLLLPNELLTTNWSKDKKKDVAPNVMYISEAFNRLNRLLTLHIMLSKDVKDIVKRTDDVIQLSDNLRFLHNFNSAYAVHLAISNVWLRNFMDTANFGISKRAKEAYEKQRVTFSVSRGQYKLQQAQFRAPYPTIPFIGLYVQQILMVCERKSTLDKLGRVNLDKFWDLEKILQKIITTRNYPYEGFNPNPKIQGLLRSLPPTKRTEQLIQQRFDSLMKKYQR